MSADPVGAPVRTLLDGLADKDADPRPSGQKQQVTIVRALFRDVNAGLATAFLNVTHARSVAETTAGSSRCGTGELAQDVRCSDV